MENENENEIKKNNPNKCCQCLNFKDHKVLYSFYIMVWIITLIFIILLIIDYTDIKFDEETSKSISLELLENFESGYFMEFHKCSPFANEIPIQFDYWQGTKKGCGISEKTKKKAIKINEGDNCKDDQETLEKIPHIKIESYKGITICGQTKGKYYDLLFSNSVVGEKEDCPEGKKVCGFIDSVKNKLCFDIDSECPISYIKIAHTPPEGITNLKEIKGDNINLYYSNNPYSNKSEIPFIQNSFKIADSKICSLPTLYYSSIDLFILDSFKEKSTTNCLSEDYPLSIIDTKRYHVLDEVDNYDLFEENNILDKIKIHNLTNYGYNINIYKHHLLFLYVRTHFGFKKECLRNREFKIEELTQTNHAFKKNKKWEIMLLISILLHILLFILSHVNCHENFFKIIIFVFLIFSIILSIGSVLLTFFIFLDSFDDSSHYEEEMDCSDAITNSNYNIMSLKIKDARHFIKIFSIFSLIIHAIDLIFIIIFIIKFNKFYEIKDKKIDIGQDKKIDIGPQMKDIKKSLIKDEDSIEPLEISKDNDNDNNKYIDENSINDNE